ncbi:MAG: DUF6445 family protein [Terricaulis sp.]
MGERHVSVDLKGHEKQPVVAIDNYCADPAALVDLARSLTFEPIGPFYPGIRAPMPKGEYGALFAPLSEILRGVFGYGARAHIDECFFSLVTTKPADLAPIQRMPHFDGVEPNRIAVLLYLCPPEHGGTSFYRHRGTGFETVSAARLDGYRASLDADVRAHGLPEAWLYPRRHAGVRACQPLWRRVQPHADLSRRQSALRGHRRQLQLRPQSKRWPFDA